ncbi:MAG: leucine-rich repeat domain-containing protein, partial [Oscillospiraceae bacterium]|nr:leucine-rich repeat domain-containing protein [Oscillospiraceae bacterium]
MKNKHLTAIFTAGILFCSTCAAVIPVSPALSAAAVQEASALDFGYTVDHDGKGVTITEYKGKAIDLVIPEKIGGLPVKAIGSAVFKNHTALTTVSIPDSVTVIGEQAFAWCEKLYDVRFPANLEEIGDSAFSVCSNLTAVVLPNGLRRIGSSAFWRCENLLGIVIPSSVNEIGSFAFEVTGWLNVRRSENAAVAVNGILIDGRNCEGKVEIPDGVTAIADQAFYDCGEVTEIVLPEGITRIGNSAFEECTSLAAVNIPETLSSIGEHAFDHCIALTEITIPPTVSAIGEEAFHNCVRLTVKAYTGSYADAYFRENEPDLPFDSLGTVSTQPAVTTSATETTESTAVSTALSAETVSTSASSAVSTALSAETSSTTESTKTYANADDFKYAVNDDGKSVRITKYTGSDAVVKIPPELGGMPVTAIGVYAFR